jgi:hypothetical protein
MPSFAKLMCGLLSDTHRTQLLALYLILQDSETTVKWAIVSFSQPTMCILLDIHIALYSLTFGLWINEIGSSNSLNKSCDTTII